tara:strand:- start:443 stop:844 length:402 start_codon:yes stop_codon:yes gene_type:complete
MPASAVTPSGHSDGKFTWKEHEAKKSTQRLSPFDQSSRTRTTKRAVGIKAAHEVASHEAGHTKQPKDTPQTTQDKRDESLGMRTGAESTKSQSYKSRSDESYGKYDESLLKKKSHKTKRGGKKVKVKNKYYKP